MQRGAHEPRPRPSSSSSSVPAPSPRALGPSEHSRSDDPRRTPLRVLARSADSSRAFPTSSGSRIFLPSTCRRPRRERGSRRRELPVAERGERGVSCGRWLRPGSLQRDRDDRRSLGRAGGRLPCACRMARTAIGHPPEAAPPSKTSAKARVRNLSRRLTESARLWALRDRGVRAGERFLTDRLAVRYLIATSWRSRSM
jgi:hypothetical protein